MKFKSILTDALLISAVAVITVFSAFYHITMVSNDGSSFRSPYCVLMAVLTILTVSGALALSVMFRKQSVCMFIAALYILCFACYLRFVLAGGTDVFGDTAIEKIMLALTFPAEAVASLGGPAAVLTVTGITGLAALTCCIVNGVRNGKNKA